MLPHVQLVHTACHCACTASCEALLNTMCGCACTGTVIDTGITHPTDYEFFLNSHASIQGTSRPALYTVLLDQNKINADELQTFSYKCGICSPQLCCPGSVNVDWLDRTGG